MSSCVAKNRKVVINDANKELANNDNFERTPFSWRQVKTLLDSNEAAPPNARLPISAFDLDQRGREVALAAARSTEIELTKNAEEEISRLDQSILYLRERFLDPLIVRPRSIFSLFGESKVTNYPLDKFVPRQQTYIPPWCQFSRRMRELVSR